MIPNSEFTKNPSEQPYKRCFKYCAFLCLKGQHFMIGLSHFLGHLTHFNYPSIINLKTLPLLQLISFSDICRSPRLRFSFPNIRWSFRFRSGLGSTIRRSSESFTRDAKSENSTETRSKNTRNEGREFTSGIVCLFV